MSLFGTAGIRGSAQDRVTPELALAVGRAVGNDAVDAVEEASRDPTVVLGRDGRETSDALAAAMEAGLESAGVDCRRVGVVPTPALAYASRGRRGVMITASHNPPTDNGIKIFEDGVEYDRDAERRIERLVDGEPDPAPWTEWGNAESADVLSRYRDAVAAYARDTFGHGSNYSGSRGDAATPLSGFSIAVDCGNGMAGLATPQVLRKLGADVVTLNANVDGHFPGRESKPTPETLTEFRAFLADGEFDFGIAHDGDADRIVIVDSEGDVVHEDTVLALLAEHYVVDAAAEDPVVVTTPNASARIDELVRAAGGRTERVRLGALHEGIARERAAGDADTEITFAAEPWKHIHPHFGGWIDGVVSAAVFSGLVAEAGSVAALRGPVTERPYRKVSVECPDEAKDAAMDRLETALPEQFPDGTVSTEYGVRIEQPDASWVLVRPSGTEPYVRVYAESEDVDALVADAVDAVERAVDDAQ
ncbi:Phosphomannomutase [Natronoarchaeum philippinense]|uniref:Phosphomannomutase n=1 Tax=Natronoarchaeum philippinense TaxID=558529 RepID=A0A285N4P4_NATPI|nr:phosphopentomutase/phosphoglucosamine mutase [Natronoarchaeum philippinense]SNZ04445.1 Phosphomannomutase [Natronoarchaeum philippinense]